MTTDRRHAWIGVAAALLVLVGGCHDASTPAPPPPRDDRPNILWVVWDTVRADRLSAYGYERPTTPWLAKWAEGALVFEDAISASNSTVPSHASMFTGLPPTEHGAHSGYRWLDDAHHTVAERVRDSGYQTYLFAANPHISHDENFAQGFDVTEHPWSPRFRERATEIVLGKIRDDDVSSELSQLAPHFRKLNKWGTKASGSLAREGLEGWLATRDPARPWFALLNYMEAHRPFLPSEAHRARMMSAEDVDRSYRIDRSWPALWGYFFGVEEYTDEELAIMAATYDATLAELDELFAELLTSLEARGWLDDTVVILTSDHGEHLGDHHMLDHQYSLYQGLVHVPLIVYGPGRIEPARDPRPVMNLDIFATVLDLAGLDGAATPHARSLLDPSESRVRLSEYPSATPEPIALVKQRHPDFDPTPWRRGLRALYAGEHKLIRGSDGRDELYDLTADPDEQRDQSDSAPDRSRALGAALDEQVGGLRPWVPQKRTLDRPNDERRRRLEALGYLAPESNAGEGAPES